MREKEKLIVTSNFSFSLNDFHRMDKLSSFFTASEIVVCEFFQFVTVQNLLSNKG